MLKALQATAPLQSRAVTIGETSLWVVANRPLYSLSVPLNEDAAFDTALGHRFGIDSRPAPGQFSQQDGFRLCGLARDQLFVLGVHSGEPDAAKLAQEVGTAAYVTDQSDAWVMVEIKGARAFSALERLCPVNLAPHAFPAGSLARTSMEHLSVIIMAEPDGGFSLLSPISSAESFWHALETSLVNVSGD